MYFYWSLRFLSDADLTLEFNIYLRGAQAHRFEVTHPPRPLIVGFVEGDFLCWSDLPAITWQLGGGYIRHFAGHTPGLLHNTVGAVQL